MKISRGISLQHAAAIKSIITILHALPGWDIGEFLQKSGIAQYDSGEPIMIQGEFGDQVYFLLSGSVKVIIDGNEICHLARKGDVFGEMGALSGATRSATTEAGEKGAICFVCDMTSIYSLKHAEQRTALLKIMSTALADKLKTSNELITNAKNKIKGLEHEKENLIRDKKALNVALHYRYNDSIYRLMRKKISIDEETGGND
jgi:CRP-like cAMP-binding protein